MTVVIQNDDGIKLAATDKNATGEGSTISLYSNGELDGGYYNGSSEAILIFDLETKILKINPSAFFQVEILNLKISLNDFNANDLPEAPKGVNTYDIVCDKSGKLYRKD